MRHRIEQQPQRPPLHPIVAPLCAHHGHTTGRRQGRQDDHRQHRWERVRKPRPWKGQVNECALEGVPRQARRACLSGAFQRRHAGTKSACRAIRSCANSYCFIAPGATLSGVFKAEHGVPARALGSQRTSRPSCSPNESRMRRRFCAPALQNPCTCPRGCWACRTTGRAGGA